MRCDLLIAQGQVLVRECIEGDGLLQGKQVLGTPGALQRLGDVVRIVLAVGGAQLRQVLGMALARSDRLHDGHAGHAREVTDDLGECEGHLLQGLGHGLHRVGGRGEQPLAVAQRGAQPAPLVVWPEGPGAQPVGVQPLQPLTSEPSGCRAAGGALGVAGIDEEHLHAPGL